MQPAQFLRINSQTAVHAKGSDGEQTAEVDQDVDLYDMLIIGRDTTGTGTALDAASQGLKMAVVKRGDFTASTSTMMDKLVQRPY